MRRGRRWVVIAVCCVVVVGVVSAGLLFVWPWTLGPWDYYLAVDSGRIPARTSDAERLARSIDPRWRQVAALIISTNKDPEGVPLLLKLLLEDRDEAVRDQAAGVLIGFDDPRIAAALSTPIKQMPPCNRRIAVQALWCKSDPLATSLLCWMLRSDEPGDRLAAIDALGRVRGQPNKQRATAALLEALPGATRREIWGISNILVRLEAREALPTLRRLLLERHDLTPRDRAWLEYDIARLEGKDVEPPAGPLGWGP